MRWVAEREETKAEWGAVGSLLRLPEDSKLLLCFVPFQRVPLTSHNSSSVPQICVVPWADEFTNPSRLGLGLNFMTTKLGRSKHLQGNGLGSPNFKGAQIPLLNPNWNSLILKENEFENRSHEARQSQYFLEAVEKHQLCPWAQWLGNSFLNITLYLVAEKKEEEKGKNKFWVSFRWFGLMSNWITQMERTKSHLGSCSILQLKSICGHVFITQTIVGVCFPGGGSYND